MMKSSQRPVMNDPALLKATKEKVVTCKKCESTWFEQVEVSQYSQYHSVIPSQMVPIFDDVVFFALRCIKCSEVYEPNIQIGLRDALRKRYEEFMQEMDRPIIDKAQNR